jgi:H+/Cl- antiporter ClcA
MNINISVFYFVCIIYIFIGVIISLTIFLLNILDICEDMETADPQFRETYKEEIYDYLEENFSSLITLIFFWFIALCIVFIDLIYKYKKRRKKKSLKTPPKNGVF